MQNSIHQQPSLVVLVVDVNVYGWEKARQAAIQAKNGSSIDGNDPDYDITLVSLFDSIICFVDAFLLEHRDNQVAVIACLPDGTAEYMFDHTMLNDHSKYSVTQAFNRSMRREIVKLGSKIENFVASQQLPKSSLASALSLALCYCNTKSATHAANDQLSSRILVVQSWEEAKANYIAAINTAFAAQKLNVVIDSFLVSDRGSTILQQICHLTGGTFLQPKILSNGAITQYLLSVFLPDLETRKYLAPPIQPPVPLKASCFCHHNLVDKGRVCSTCLSVFCEASLKKIKYFCPTCTTKRAVNRPTSRTKKESIARLRCGIISLIGVEFMLGRCLVLWNYNKSSNNMVVN